MFFSRFASPQIVVYTVPGSVVFGTPLARSVSIVVYEAQYLKRRRGLSASRSFPRCTEDGKNCARRAVLAVAKSANLSWTV